MFFIISSTCHSFYVSEDVRDDIYDYLRKERYVNDTETVRCVMKLLGDESRRSESKSSRQRQASDTEIGLHIMKAEEKCSRSPLATPLAIAALVSFIVVSFAYVFYCLKRIFRYTNGEEFY